MDFAQDLKLGQYMFVSPFQTYSCENLLDELTYTMLTGKSTLAYSSMHKSTRVSSPQSRKWAVRCFSHNAPHGLHTDGDGGNSVPLDARTYRESVQLEEYQSVHVCWHEGRLQCEFDLGKWVSIFFSFTWELRQPHS